MFEGVLKIQVGYKRQRWAFVSNVLCDTYRVGLGETQGSLVRSVDRVKEEGTKKLLGER